MFDNLIESKARGQRTVGQTFLSLVVHGLLIFVAVKATTGVAETMTDRPVDTTMVFLKPPPPPPPKPPEPKIPRPPAQVQAPTPEAVIVKEPPPKGFQTVAAPIDIPTEIPPIDLNQKAFDPKDFTGKGVEGGVSTGVVGGTGPADDVKGDVFLEAQLDDPVQAISQPQPRYPPMLQSANIAGRVEVEYVVDVTGHVEPSSFKIIKSTHKAFEAPAKEAILKSVFKPAKFRGKPVRQLVRQALSFKIT